MRGRAFLFAAARLTTLQLGASLALTRMPPKMNLALAPAPAPGSPVAVPGPIYPEPAGRVINSPDRFAPSVRGDAAIDDALAASEAFAEEFIISGVKGPSIFRDPRSPLHAIDATFPRGFVPTHRSPAPRSS